MSHDRPSFLQVNDNKAGMSNLDKDKINEIILEVSKGSRFYDNEMKKDKILNNQIDILLKKRDKLTPEQLEEASKKADRMFDEYRLNMELSNAIVHIDMDAFFAAVEIKDDASLRKRPMAVGSASMLSTSNYEARRYGVRAGMPGFIAKKLCPDLIIIEPNFDKYSRTSRSFRDIFLEYDPNFVGYCLDEATLDITKHLRKRFFYTPDQLTYQCEMICECAEPNNIGGHHSSLFKVCGDCGKLNGSPTKRFSITIWGAVEELRFRIFCRTQLTCSAGIACNALLAKIAADLNKPNGQYQISSIAEDIKSFIDELPIRKIPGIGKVTEKKLAALGINKCGDIYSKRDILYHLFKPLTFCYFLKVSIGYGGHEFYDTETDDNFSSADRKSMSVERTFSDCDDEIELVEKCKSLCIELCEDLSKSNIMGKCISIKLKLSTFEVRTRAITITEYTNDVETVMKYACDLLLTEINNCYPCKLSLRLLGVRMSSLIKSSLIVNDGQINIVEAFKKRSGKESTSIKDNTQTRLFPIFSNVTNTKSESRVECPVCNRHVVSTLINEHLDACLITRLPDEPSTSSDRSRELSLPNKAPTTLSSVKRPSLDPKQMSVKKMFRKAFDDCMDQEINKADKENSKFNVD